MRIAIVLGVAIGLVALAAFAYRRSRNPRALPAPVVGGIYSVNADDSGNVGVIKVLAIDPSGVHVSLYKNKFTSRPASVDETKLEFGTIHDPEPPGIMHVPLSNAAYTRLEPQFVQQSKMSAAELSAIKDWAGGGGYWP